MSYKYCYNLNEFTRFASRNVKIGNSDLGGHAAIRIQSMTNTDTLNTQASVEQCIRIFDAGADFVRLTVQTVKHAENLKKIKSELKKRGYKGALIADVHFNPKVAEIAAQIVEKVRVNPGNFVDRNKTQSYTEHEYNAELAKIDKKFTKLIKICKENNTALRIGSNHGSLSARIVDKYGDTPLGMVESVMEFLTIAQKENFHEIVISLKSSNTRVMVYAYRILMQKMLSAGMDYPVHLGVTEAGDGEDGRIKSTVGISSLLADGIGDTVRVSLTEDPEKEIPVAQKIVDYINLRVNHRKINFTGNIKKSPFEYSRRDTFIETGIGSHHVPIVIADLHKFDKLAKHEIEKMGFEFDETREKWQRGDLSPDYLFIGNLKLHDFPLGGLNFISDYSVWEKSGQGHPYFNSLDDYARAEKKSKKINFISASNNLAIIQQLKLLKKDKTIVLLLKSENKNNYADKRAFVHNLISGDLKFPVISVGQYKTVNEENFQIEAAADHGPLLIDGLFDGLMLFNENKRLFRECVNLSFGILQASRSRISKTEYISCPSCGRTLFDIQTVTKEIKEKTNQLKGVKIGIMGCIVNGPGEMADADYGYVGTGIGKVSLYKGQDIFKKNVSSKNAVSELIQLIKDNGDWVDF
jgi:(E)-4-hydroxy-3-methylbut-2-enyl-diphosphate synthase